MIQIRDILFQSRFVSSFRCFTVLCKRVKALEDAVDDLTERVEKLEGKPTTAQAPIGL